jgi:hypothetical protein
MTWPPRWASTRASPSPRYPHLPAWTRSCPPSVPAASTTPASPTSTPTRPTTHVRNSASQVVSMAVVVATGITADVGREVLGLDVGDREDRCSGAASSPPSPPRPDRGPTGHLRPVTAPTTARTVVHVSVTCGHTRNDPRSSRSCGRTQVRTASGQSIPRAAAPPLLRRRRRGRPDQHTHAANTGHTDSRMAAGGRDIHDQDHDLPHHPGTVPDTAGRARTNMPPAAQEGHRPP